MNREELSEAIHDLASTPHLSRYALEHAMAHLDLEELKCLFDNVADHHDLVDTNDRSATAAVAATHTAGCSCDACSWQRRVRRRSGFVGS